MWISPTPTPRTQIFIDVPVDGAGLKVSSGMSNGRSAAVQANNEIPPFRCFTADISTCWMLCVSLLLVCRPCIHSSILGFVFSFLCISLCSRSTSFSGEVRSSCHECSLSLMICHYSSATRSPTFIISSPSSSGCFLSIEKSSPYLLYLMPVILHPHFLLSVVMGRSSSVHFGTSSYSGPFQSSSKKDPSSELTSTFSLLSILMLSLPLFFFLVPFSFNSHAGSTSRYSSPSMFCGTH